jgi:UDP-glucoronosyl and UDP-glucosyl transferase
MAPKYCIFSYSVLLLFATSMLELTSVDAAKILMIVVQYPSHTAVKRIIGSELVRRGHEVHVILVPDHPMLEEFRQDGINVISYRPAADVMHWATPECEDTMANMIFNRTREQPWLKRLLIRECDAMMSDQSFLDQLKAYHFDLVVTEPFIVLPCYLLVPHYLGLPYVTSTFYLPPILLRLPILPSFYTNLIIGPELVKYPVLKTFTQRLTNIGDLALSHLIIHQLFLGDTSLLQKYAPEVKSWNELILRSELTIFENDYLLESSIPLLPHVVTVAGITARPAEPLPDNLENIMAQSGNEGVILASFGTIAFHMPAETAIKFLDVFGRLKETVITRMAVPAGIKVRINIYMFTQFLLLGLCFYNR